VDERSATDASRDGTSDAERLSGGHEVSDELLATLAEVEG